MTAVDPLSAVRAAHHLHSLQDCYARILEDLQAAARHARAIRDLVPDGSRAEQKIESYLDATEGLMELALVAKTGLDGEGSSERPVS